MKTVQMYFTIYYPDHDQMQELKGKINIGDGNGGIVSQLKNQNEMKLHDESWLNYQKGKGEESFQAYMADLTDMQEHVLPYLQSFCSLEEKAPEKVDILLSVGMHCLGCPSSQMETVGEAAMVHGYDPDELVEEINTFIDHDLG